METTKAGRTVLVVVAVLMVMGLLSGCNRKKTYRDEKYAFEIQYQKDWTEVYEKAPSGDVSLQLTSPELKEAQEEAVKSGTGGEGPQADVTISTVPFATFEELEAQSVKEDWEVIKTERMTIHGYNADVFTLGGASLTIAVYLKIDGRIVEIIFHNRERLEDLSPAEEQILASFRQLAKNGN